MVVCLCHLGETEMESHIITGSKNVKGKITICLQESFQTDIVMAKDVKNTWKTHFHVFFAAVKATLVAISKTALILKIKRMKR